MGVYIIYNIIIKKKQVANVHIPYIQLFIQIWIPIYSKKKKISKYPNLDILPLIAKYLKKYLNLDRIFLSRKNFLDRVFPVLYTIYDYPDNSITQSGSYPPGDICWWGIRAKTIYLKT